MLVSYLHVPLLGAIALSLLGCADDAPPSSTAGEPTTSVAATGERSLDVTYDDGVIELSFARLGHPFRAMYASVLTWSEGRWRRYGTLSTENANTIGALTTGEDPVEVLDGVNTARAPDRYRAPELPPGRYLICTTLPDVDLHQEFCGEFAWEGR